MVSDFQKKHILNFLDLLEEEGPASREIVRGTISSGMIACLPLGRPLDLQMNSYVREHKSIGSKDRKIFGDTIYELVRWLGLIDAHLDSPITWEKRLDLFLTTPKGVLQANPSLAAHQKVSFPKEFYDTLLAQRGEDQAQTFCLNSNLTAPITVRTNTLKTSRQALLDKLSHRCAVSPCNDSPTAILFHKKINFFELPEFKEGLFEIQDEASQLVADQVEAKPGDEILDFCAGSGGKSLAIAPKLLGKGQIFLHDIRKKSLYNAKLRLNRAGIQNMQILTSLPKSLHKRMDWILLDVPCSGSGTWRRNPDQKWKFSLEMLQRICKDQQAIIEAALPYLSPKGKLVYATCSVLAEENEAQIAYILKQHNLSIVKPFFQTFPLPGEKDGFFAATLAYSPA